jgi:hypothetical protein
MQVAAAGQEPFAPVPLAVGKRGCPAEELEKALRIWAASPPLRALAAASGWSWPTESSTLELLSKLAALSADWDFRQNRERAFIGGQPAEVRGRKIPDALVIPAARALGLVESAPVTARRVSHLVVLGGHATACVNRVHHAAALLRRGVRADKVVVLGAHRRLVRGESEAAAEAGLGLLDDEAAVVLAAARQVLDLGAPAVAKASPPTPGPDRLTALHAAFAQYGWPGTDVVIAPSDLPAQRRAKTGDQLRYWARTAGLHRGHNVLLVTTQISVPYQHLVASRVLGLERHCAVSSCGVDAGTSVVPVPAFGGREYLQEIRAALRAALALLRQARQAPAEATEGV